jgi:HlyD family secretion protein
MAALDPSRQSASRWRRRLLLLVVVLAASYAAFRYLSRPQPVAVIVQTVGRGRVERSVANTRAGTVKACQRAKLSPQAAGRIVALRVKEGQRIKAGQVLLELWDEDTAAQLRAAEDRRAVTLARRREACLAAEVAEREARRVTQLYHEGLVPLDRFDQVTVEAQARRASCEAAAAEVSSSESQIKVARAAQERTVLKAPFPGIVAKVSGELGEVATPSPPGIPTPPAIDLIDDSCLYVTVPIDEVDAAAIRVGMPGRITLDAFAGRKFAGRVRRIAPFVLEIEKQARTVDVEVEFADRDQTRALLVGYSADAEIILDVRDEVLRVPTQALQQGGRVFVYDPATATIHSRTLRTGLSNWEFTEVLDGLRPGDRIVLSWQREGVVEGAPVVLETRAADPPRP